MQSHYILTAKMVSAGDWDKDGQSIRTAPYV